jgi:cytochrome c551
MRTRLTLLAAAATLAAGPLTGTFAADPRLTTAAQAASPAAPPLNAAGEGRRAYLKYNCYSCHGMYAGGGMGPNIVHAETGDVSEAVLQGEDHGMPSFKRYVTSQEINYLGAYLRSIGSAKEPKFMDWWEPVPSK